MLSRHAWYTIAASHSQKDCAGIKPQWMLHPCEPKQCKTTTADLHPVSVLSHYTANTASHPPSVLLHARTRCNRSTYDN